MYLQSSLEYQQTGLNLWFLSSVAVHYFTNRAAIQRMDPVLPAHRLMEMICQRQGPVSLNVFPKNKYINNLATEAIFFASELF